MSKAKQITRSIILNLLKKHKSPFAKGFEGRSTFELALAVHASYGIPAPYRYASEEETLTKLHTVITDHYSKKEG